MAFPFKNGGDFYNCEAQRMRLHNLGANPTETAIGLMYFNTGASNLGKHAVVHDGTNFKALAFVDEIATNAEFVELKEKVDLLIGDDVDTNTIIDSWKEVQAFLADIEDTKTLQGMLSSYLPKSGGTISGSSAELLTLDSSNASYNAILFKSSGVAKSEIGFTPSGGTYIYDYTKNKYLGIDIDGVPFYGAKSGSTKYTLIHSGNIGSYKAGDSALLDGLAKNEFYRSNMDLIPISGDIAALETGCYWVYENLGQTNPVPSIYTSLVAFGKSHYSPQMCVVHNASKAWLRGIYNSSSGFSASDWHELAFMDSNVASATKLAGTYHGSADVSSNPYFWLNESGKTIYYLRAYNGNLCLGPTEQSFVINPSGNVTIGGSDFAGTGYKLMVDGLLGMMNGTTKHGVLGFSDNNLYLGYSSVQFGTVVNGQTVSLQTTNNSIPKLHITNGGNVGIGTTDPKKKLHVVGDLYVDGNIIATKEVSAGGVGQEGESGDGGAEVISQQLAKGQSTYTITNTIKRSDIAVSLYEWNANNESWDMCLADISVKDSTITVTFGSATSVNHKLVAVG